MNTLITIIVSKIKGVGELTISENDTNNYKQRFINEYVELKDRYNKLHKMLIKYDAGILEFAPTCPINILREQESIMFKYLNILETRAIIEDVEFKE